MKPTRSWFSAPFLAAALLASSCGEPAPVAPTVQGAGPALSQASWQGTLLQCRPLAYDSITEMVTPAGGDLRVSKHVLSIPPHALSRPTRITLVVPPDTVNRIQLQPEGLVFEQPVALTMSYVNCHTDASTDPKQIVYTDDALTILEYEPSIDDTWGKKVTARLSHFSQYALSW